jgi:hypothetical protein
LHYETKPSYATFIGNSLKYYSTTFLKNNNNTLFRFYQLQNTDSTITPLSLLASSGDLDNLLSTIGFSETGLDYLIEANAFAHARKISKLPPVVSFDFSAKAGKDML